MRALLFWVFFPFGLATFAFVTLPAIAVALAVAAVYLIWRAIQIIKSEGPPQ